MLGFYVVVGVVGGMLILLTVLTGGGDSELEAPDGDAEVDIHGDVDLQTDVDADGDVDGHLDVDHVDTGLWLPFLSLRFWTFFAFVFGLTGTLLTFLDQGGGLTLAVSLAGGSVSGWLAAYVQRRLIQDQVSSGVTSKDYVGQVGKVRLPVGGGREGQIRTFVKGTTIDLLAVAETDEPIPVGEKVLIIDMVGATAKVVPMKAALESGDAKPTLPERSEDA